MSAVTDEQGNYSIPDLRPWAPVEYIDPQTGEKQMIGGQRPFLVQHPDFPTTQALHAGIPQTVDVTLHPPAIVEGSVVDVVTNQLAAGVVVCAQGTNNHDWFETLSDKNGRFRLRMTRGRYNIWAEAPDRIGVAESVMAVPGEFEQARVNLVHGGFVHGQLIDADTNQPLRLGDGQWISVAHYGPARPRTGAAVTNTRVNPDGTYRLRVAPGENHVYVMNKHASKDVTVREGEEVTVDFRVHQTDQVWNKDDPRIEIIRQMRDW
jgi:hypothetical protein